MRTPSGTAMAQAAPKLTRTRSTLATMSHGKSLPLSNPTIVAMTTCGGGNRRSLANPAAFTHSQMPKKMTQQATPRTQTRPAGIGRRNSNQRCCRGAGAFSPAIRPGLY